MGLNYLGLLICGFIFNKYVLRYYKIHCGLNLGMWNHRYGRPVVRSWVFNYIGASATSPCVVQGSTVIIWSTWLNPNDLSLQISTATQTSYGLIQPLGTLNFLYDT